MVIMVESPFDIGDIVCHILDETQEHKMIISGIYVIQTDKTGVASYYTYDCADVNGTLQGYKPQEIKLIEKVES